MSAENVVKFDIGGTVFKTTKSTLTKFDGMLKTMFETGVPVEKDEFGCIFIDRSPKHFDLILNFMRDGHVALPESVAEVEEIHSEATYYLLEELIEKCEPIIDQKNKMKKFRHIECKAKISETVLCSAKPVLICTYSQFPNIDQLTLPDLIDDFEEFIEEFEEKLDIYFLAGERGGASWECILYKDGETKLFRRENSNYTPEFLMRMRKGIAEEFCGKINNQPRKNLPSRY